MEKDYSNLPEKYWPIGPWKYFGLTILYSIPVLGFVFLLIHAIGAPNINKRNFARSYFCILALAAVLVIIAIASGGISDLIQQIAALGQ